MTVIRLVTKDQELIIAEKPLLASGDVNSVVLHVDFDSAWGRYIARTAVFYTSKDSTVYEKLLTNNGECIIPDEVLTDTGTLFVGVRGVPVDGSAQKTSALVKYKIVEGAKPGTYTIHVTPDLYQQYIEAIKRQCDPVTTQMRSDFDDQMEVWKNDYNNIKSLVVRPCSFADISPSKRPDIWSHEGDNWSCEEDCWVSLQGTSSVQGNSVELFIWDTLAASYERGAGDTAHNDIINFPPIYVPRLTPIRAVSGSINDSLFIAYGCLGG